MTKQSSRTKILLKKLAVIPVIAGFTFLFAERVEAQKKDINKAPVSIQVKNGAKNLKGESSEETLVVYTYEDGSTIQKKYDDLTLEEKQQLPPPPPPKKRVYRRTPPTPNSPRVRMREESNIPSPPTRVKKGDISRIPLPPPHIRVKKGMRTPPESMSPLEYIKKHKDYNSEYYYNGKKISYKKAIKLLESDSSINLHSWYKNDKAVFKLSNKPITIKN